MASSAPCTRTPQVRAGQLGSPVRATPSRGPALTVALFFPHADYFMQVLRDQDSAKTLWEAHAAAAQAAAAAALAEQGAVSPTGGHAGASAAAAAALPAARSLGRAKSFGQLLSFLSSPGRATPAAPAAIKAHSVISSGGGHTALSVAGAAAQPAVEAAGELPAGPQHGHQGQGASMQPALSHATSFGTSAGPSPQPGVPLYSQVG